MGNKTGVHQRFALIVISPSFCFSHPIYPLEVIMSTNARIGIKLEDGSILSAYHHWDGYPEWLGVTLKEQYNTKEKVADLLDGGNMSSCYSDNVYDYETVSIPFLSALGRKIYNYELKREKNILPNLAWIKKI